MVKNSQSLCEWRGKTKDRINDCNDRYGLSLVSGHSQVNLTHLLLCETDLRVTWVVPGGFAQPLLTCDLQDVPDWLRTSDDAQQWLGSIPI